MKYLVAVTTVFLCLASQAGPVAIPIEQVQSFEFDEFSQSSVIEALVIYRDGCYRPVAQSIEVQYRVGQIHLYHYAERESLTCILALQPKQIRFNIGHRLSNDSTFVDGATGKLVPVTWK